MTNEPTLTEKPAVEKLIDEIMDARQKSLKTKLREQTKRPYMYLSDIHRCTRHNYYSMVEGDKRRPINEWLICLFESGNMWERETVRELLDLGFDVILGQQSIEINYGGKLKSEKGKIIGKGRIDGMIRYGKERFPLEIKSLGENIFRQINTVEDLFRFEFTEKYLRQLLMYLYGNNLEQGFFLINDRSGHWKLIPVYLGNYLDYCEKVLRNMEAAWEAKVEGKEPARINYNHKTCGNCQFNAVCCPETILEGGDVLNDPELEAQIAIHEELKPKAKEYNEVHDSLKALFEKKPQTTIGRFIVIPKKTTRRGGIKISELPGDVQKSLEQYRGKPTDSWSFSVDNIEKPAEKEAE